MVVIKIYDENEIDTYSDFIKEKVSDAIKKYIVKNWDKCVYLEQYQDDKLNYNVEFKITL